MDDRLPHGTGDGLGTGPQLLLWGIRTWTACHPSEVLVRLGHGFRLAGLADEVVTLDRLMRAVVAGTRVPVRIHAPCCRCLGRDERQLLEFAAVAPRMCALCLDARLRLWLTPTGARHAAIPMVVLGRAFGQVGLPLDALDEPAGAQRRLH
ncbi:MAG: hypothetical protein ACTS3R_16795 [Inquilinaceae bacterium]